MPEPLTAAAPFPEVFDIYEDAFSLRIISPAYASPTGELNAVLQYVYHSLYFEKFGYKEISETLMSIAIAEMIHLKKLGGAILSLGAPPVYCRCPYSGFDYYSAKYVAYSRSLRFMLEDDAIGERQAIRDYGLMLKKLKNAQVAEIVSRIREDEVLHLNALQAILKDFKG